MATDSRHGASCPSWISASCCPSSSAYHHISRIRHRPSSSACHHHHRAVIIYHHQHHHHHRVVIIIIITSTIIIICLTTLKRGTHMGKCAGMHQSRYRRGTCTGRCSAVLLLLMMAMAMAMAMTMMTTTRRQCHDVVSILITEIRVSKRILQEHLAPCKTSSSLLLCRALKPHGAEKAATLCTASVMVQRGLNQSDARAPAWAAPSLRLPRHPPARRPPRQALP